MQSSICIITLSLDPHETYILQKKQAKQSSREFLPQFDSLKDTRGVTFQGAQIIDHPLSTFLWHLQTHIANI